MLLVRNPMAKVTQEINVFFFSLYVLNHYVDNKTTTKMKDGILLKINNPNHTHKIYGPVLRI